MATKRETMKDEQVLAAIISGAKGDGAKVRRGSWGVEDGWDSLKTSNGKVTATGPVCAVGAACLYKGIPAGGVEDALAYFESKYRVSHTYACGVSDGFEATPGHFAYGDAGMRSHDEYARGFSVGAQVAAILNPRGLDTEGNEPHEPHAADPPINPYAAPADPSALGPSL